ncbi:(d)CMP kinase [Candidatus Altiarchaeota archaeon]
MIVTCGGEPASGKSTLAKNLAGELGFKHVSAGQVMREMAAERGLDILEFSKLAESDPSIDKLIDERQKEEASGDCVVDGRLSRYFLDPDVSIWLTCPLKERASRALGRGESHASLDDAVDALSVREDSEVARYREYYGIDLRDLRVYDLVLNTGLFGKKQMTELALFAIRASGKI